MQLDWKNGFVTEPFDKQKPYIQDAIDPSIQYVTACCGLQSGKTIVESDALYACLYGPNPLMLPVGPRGRTPMEVWLASKSYSLAMALLETFRWRTPANMWASEKDMRRWGVTRDDRFTFYLQPRQNCEDQAPIRLRVRTASDPDGMRATPTLGAVVADELARWKPTSWLNLQARGIVARTKFLAGTTTNGKNFVYRELALPAGYGGGKVHDPQKRIHTWTSADNPYADKKHIERLRRIFGREYAKQELEGLFTDSIGYVYGQFDRTTMMVPIPSENPDDYLKITGGIDFGWTDAFAGCVWGQWKGDGKWYQLWELHETQSTPVDLAPMFKEAQNKWEVPAWYGDRSGPTNIRLLRNEGIRVQPYIDIHAENDTRTIPVMLAVCQGLMQQDCIRIGTEHDWTAEEFENYHYKDQSDDDPKNTHDIPVDWMNHHMDAMRYALCSVIEIPSAKNRYRQGPDQKPREYVVAGKRSGSPVPSMAEAMRMQDKKFDEQIARANSARTPDERWLKHRLRNKL